MYLKEETHHIPKNWKVCKISLLPQNPSWGGQAGSHLKSLFKDKQKVFLDFTGFPICCD